jgi:GGDEF domain-containing protein
MISASMGAAFWPDDGELMQNLLRAADQRMYEDKARQKQNSN